MMEDYSQVSGLMAEMEQNLPIPAHPSSQLVQILRGQGLKASTERALYIRRVFYLGDEGGISCDVTPTQDAGTAFAVSLTHLRVPEDHPLFARIRAYQKKRGKRITRAA